jgi:hypothetical protein
MAASTEDMSSLAARLDAMGEAVKLVRATASAMPTPGMVQASVDALDGLVREQRQSSKEAIDKSEKSVESRIGEQGKRLDDLKSRLDILDGSIAGMRTLILIVSAVLSLLVAASNFLRPLAVSRNEPQIVYVPSAPGMPPVTAAPASSVP